MQRCSSARLSCEKFERTRPVTFPLLTISLSVVDRYKTLFGNSAHLNK